MTACEAMMHRENKINDKTKLLYLMPQNKISVPVNVDVSDCIKEKRNIFQFVLL